MVTIRKPAFFNVVAVVPERGPNTSSESDASTMARARVRAHRKRPEPLAVRPPSCVLRAREREKDAMLDSGVMREAERAYPTAEKRDVGERREMEVAMDESKVS